MSKIHISRDRQSLGHFFPDEVAVGLRTGRFYPTDLAWQDPMEIWKPLSEFADLPVVEVDPEMPPPIPEQEGKPAPVVAAGPGEPAWERPGSASFLVLLVKTIGQIFSQPAATFRALNPDAPMGRAIRYYLILSTLGAWVYLACNLIMVLMVPEMVKTQMGGKFTTSQILTGQIFNMLFAPFFLAGLAFGFSGVLHLMLTLFGVPQPVFAVTVRVFCYAVGTSFLLNLIPLCGPFFFIPCAVVFLVLGLKEAHRTDAFRPLIAVMIPAFLLCLGFLLLLLQAGLLK